VLVAPSLVGVLLGAGAYTAQYASGLSYLSNDPRACVNCHIMREHYDGWQKASHHAHATCNDCHVPPGGLSKYLTKAENGFWHSKGFTLQDFHEPIRIRPKNQVILEQNCQRCHQELVSEIRAHATAPAAGSDCVRCHAAVGHGPR
jgi:cytochrome c nitrite reductase small subunit